MFDSVMQEIAVLKRLDHTNIIRLHEIIDDPDEDKIYLITDYLKCGSLQTQIDKDSLTSEKIRNYFRDLIAGLRYCHQCANVVHRDVKPENIMINEEGRAVLVDFGVSSHFEGGVDELLNSAGSYCYFAPELV